MEYKIKRTNRSDTLSHAGKPGMKWGYNDGKKNGKRTADEIEERVYYDNVINVYEPGSNNTYESDSTLDEERKPWENGTEVFDMLMDSPLHGIGARMIEKAFSALVNEGKKWYETNRDNRPIVSVGYGGANTYKRR